MPGIIGFTHDNANSAQYIDTLNKMQKIITHQDFYVKDVLFCDNNICATRSHINVIQKEPQPYIKDDIYIWMDGEFFNQTELNKKIGNAKNDLEYLFKLYQSKLDFSFLKLIDGIYSAVIYDTKKQKIFLISDRYGLRNLFWTVYDNSLIWASELKAMLCIPGYRPIIDPQAVEEFFSMGYMLEDQTWFKNVQLLSSGCILEWDIQTLTFNKKRYWWWDEIKPISKEIDEKVIVKTLGKLFIDAVNRRIRQGERVGLLLSGGLDSRALLASIPVSGKDIHTITFGKPGCQDIRYAEMASNIKGARHDIFSINKDNWLYPRLQGIWWTDGQYDMMHMHGIEMMYDIKQLCDVNLSGFAGDLIIGGSYLKRPYLDNTISDKLIKSVTKCNKNLNFEINKYIDLHKTDYYFIQNRVRRFTNDGTKFLQVFIEDRKPFFDNKLIEYVYSIPDKYRYKSRIYKLMLLQYFPEYYYNIPWQKTGYPISWPNTLIDILHYIQVFCSLPLKLIRVFGVAFQNNKNYTDYPAWIRSEPARSFFTDVLNNPEAIYPAYISKDIVHYELEQHLKGADFSSNLCRYLTFEIWLQQIFNNRYIK